VIYPRSLQEHSLQYESKQKSVRQGEFERVVGSPISCLEVNELELVAIEDCSGAVQDVYLEYVLLSVLEHILGFDLNGVDVRDVDCSAVGLGAGQAQIRRSNLLQSNNKR